MENNDKNDSRFNLLTAGLLVLVITLLALLWIRERRDRVFLYNKAAQLEAKCQQMQDTVKALALKEIQRSMPLGADDVTQVHQGVRVGDREVKVLVITPSAGEVRGIKPGQTLSVSPESTIQPAVKN